MLTVLCWKWQPHKGYRSTFAPETVNVLRNMVARHFTPTAGSHTYSIRAAVSNGTGTVDANVGGSGSQMPGFIRITG